MVRLRADSLLVLTSLGLLAAACNPGGGNPNDAGNQNVEVPHGPAPRCKAYPDVVGIAELSELGTTGTKAQVPVDLFQEGSVSTVDTVACTQITGTRDPKGLFAAWLSCTEAYDCGGCELWVGYFAGDTTKPEGWYLATGEPPGQAGCTQWQGFYQIKDPSEVRDPAGSGTGSGTGSKGGDPCKDCLSGCYGLSSCCTGSGCLCQSECRPVGCSPGTALCCGPYGSCICMSNCPY